MRRREIRTLELAWQFSEPLFKPGDEVWYAGSIVRSGTNAEFHLVANREELSMPPKITMEMARGFTLYMVKAVMNDRADEVLEIAATNLWR